MKSIPIPLPNLQLFEILEKLKFIGFIGFKSNMPLKLRISFTNKVPHYKLNQGAVVRHKRTDKNYYLMNCILR